jgi:hypothetical protein
VAATNTLLSHDCTEETLTALSDTELLHGVDEILMEIDRVEPTAAAEMLWCLLNELFERHIPDAALQQTLRFHREHDPDCDLEAEASGSRSGMARRSTLREQHARSLALDAPR